MGKVFVEWFETPSLCKHKNKQENQEGQKEKGRKQQKDWVPPLQGA